MAELIEQAFQMEFRPRNYVAEEQSHALPRSSADFHPLFSASTQTPLRQVQILYFVFCISTFIHPLSLSLSFDYSLRIYDCRLMITSEIEITRSSSIRLEHLILTHRLKSSMDRILRVVLMETTILFKFK